MLVSRPDLVYFLAGQAEEIEGSGFPFYVAAGTPGAEIVERRLLEARYTLIVETWPLPPLRPWLNALQGRYRYLGGCRLGWYFGSVVSHVHVRRDLRAALPQGPSVRCLPAQEARTDSP